MSMTTETTAIVPVWTVGDRLAKARIEAGIRTAKEMAARMGVAERTIRNWESGATRVTHHVCVAWANLTGVSLAWLEGDDYSPDLPPRVIRCTHARHAA